MLPLVDLFKLFPSLASVTHVWGKRKKKREAGRQHVCHMEVKDTILGKKEQKINARGRQNQLEIGEQLRGILGKKFLKN